MIYIERRHTLTETTRLEFLSSLVNTIYLHNDEALEFL